MHVLACRAGVSRAGVRNDGSSGSCVHDGPAMAAFELGARGVVQATVFDACGVIGTMLDIPYSAWPGCSNGMRGVWTCVHALSAMMMTWVTDSMYALGRLVTDVRRVHALSDI